MSKDVLVMEEDNMLIEGNLSGTLAALGAVDTSVLGDVALDIVDDMEVFKNDIVIPKVHLIQAMSELRKAKKADEGDYLDSRSEEVILRYDDENALPLYQSRLSKDGKHLNS